jgi:hypothetical protein
MYDNVCDSLSSFCMRLDNMDICDLSVRAYIGLLLENHGQYQQMLPDTLFWLSNVEESFREGLSYNDIFGTYIDSPYHIF